MSPNHSSTRCVRMQTASFQQNHNAQPFEAKGWRCFINQSKTGLVTWILKRGASVAMFAQSLTDSMTQDMQLPVGADSSELCDLFVQTGIGTPV